MHSRYNTAAGDPVSSKDAFQLDPTMSVQSNWLSVSQISSWVINSFLSAGPWLAPHTVRSAMSQGQNPAQNGQPFYQNGLLVGYQQWPNVQVQAASPTPVVSSELLCSPAEWELTAI